MPSRTVQGGQDWAPVNVGSSTIRKPTPKTAAGIAAAKKAGLMGTEKRLAVNWCFMSACVGQRKKEMVIHLNMRMSHSSLLEP